MSLYGPAALFWLIPLLGAILALYLLKMKRRDVQVPATFLWPDMVEEIRANSLFQRLRFSLLLLLQLLAALLVCLAVSRPQVMQKGLTGRTSVIIIDSSLTMGASDVNPTRLEYAKAKAREIVSASAPGERLAIIDAGAVPRVLSPLAHDPNAQLRAIDQIRQSDAPASVGEALRIGASLVGSNGSGRIVLISDGAFGSVSNFNPGKASFAFESVGESQEDLAVTALGVTDSANGRLVYCAVKNLGLSTHAGALTVLGDGATAHSERISVAAGQTWSTTFSAPADVNVFEAKLESGDILKADDYAATQSLKGSKLHVLLLTQEDPFTEKALALDPRVTLDRGSELPDSERSAATAKYDLVVFDGVPEQPVGCPGVLVLGSAARGDKVSVKGGSTTSTYVSQKSDPILSAVDLSQVRIVKAQKLNSIQADTLADGSEGPEVLAVRGAQRRVYLSFEPLDSNFPLQPSFPIFIANCLSYLGQSSDSGPIVVHPGSAFALTGRSTGEVTNAEGFKSESESKGGLVTLAGLPQVGKYSLALDGKSRAVYCSLNEAPKTLTPSATLTAGGQAVTSSAAALSTVDVWRYFAFGFLALLAAEWWLFARRS